MKKKAINILMILASIMFVTDGISILANHQEQPIFMIVVAWIDIILFGGGALVGIYMTFGPRRALPVSWNQNYLCIHYYFYHRDIEWKHITGFSPYSWQDVDWVLVHVDNVDEMMASTGNWFRRMGLKLTYKQYGALYAIQAENLIMTPKQLCEHLEQELKKHKPTVSAYM